MEHSDTDIVLIGFQNDYFSEQGVLYSFIDNFASLVLRKTLTLIDQLLSTETTFITTPIYFTPDYSELVNPIGILKIVQDLGAFKKGGLGSKTIPELMHYGERILTVADKRRLNAFHSTHLDLELKNRGMHDVLLTGVATSICIDATACSAFEQGFKVYALSNGTAGRSQFEQDFYCKEVLPLYSTVIDSASLLENLYSG